jgi:hypothetical protein
VRQLRQLETLPTYISVEAISADLIDILAEVGYTEFQVVNQALFWQFIPPQPPLEGGYVDVKFNGHMSGLFGKELPADRWFTAARIKETFLQFLALRRVDPNLTYGWLDFHARRPA